MNQDKKAIILNEIEHWRRSRLLPEQYCDFLQNLYSDEPEGDSRSFFSLGQIQQGSWKLWSLSFGIISFFFFIVFYFSAFPWGLQIAAALLLCFGCYSLAAYHRRNRPLYALCAAGLGSLLLLGFGGWTIRLQGWEADSGAALLIAVCGIVWIAAGYSLRLGILTYCGFVCGILLYAILFERLHPETSWALLQLLWLPVAALLFWLSWLSHHRLKQSARVFFAVSLTLWFMPEADVFLLRHAAYEGMAALALLKMAAAFLILFVLRKKWVVWIAS